MKEFHIHFNNESPNLIAQYHAMYEKIAVPRYLPKHSKNNATIYDIKPEYGEGSIQMYILLGDALLFIYDFTFHTDIITKFELNKDYFEIEYCIEGLIHIDEDSTGVTNFQTNDLSISLTSNMSGRVIRPASQKYKGVSISASRESLSSYFGSSGVGAWNQTIESLEEELRRSYYLGLNPSMEVSNAFQQLFACRLPIESRNLYYESKVMEIISLIISEQLIKEKSEKPSTLSKYEIEQIKQVPQILLDHLFDLPSIKDLAKQLVINEKKLVQGFKAVYGDTIYSHHRKQVLQQSARLLLQTDKSISDIAYDSGYSNPSNFSAAFKKMYGVSPLQYRDSSLLK